MPFSSGPNTVNDSIVFNYDIGDTANSYIGEPTTNIAYNQNNYLNSNSNWWTNSGAATFNDNDTTITKPSIPNVDTSNLRVFSAQTTTTGNQQLGSSIISVSSSTIYSFSIWYYFTGTSMQAQPYVRTSVNNDSIATFAYNGDTNYLNWPRNKWILLKATCTTQSNENGIYMSSYIGDNLGEKVYYFGYQIEQKSHCTPLVLGTRSTTQGLLDVSGVGNSIDISNASFDSNAQMTFDGTNDYVDITTSLGTLSQYTIEHISYKGSDNRMPIAFRGGPVFYQYGDNSWYYTHGGTAGEYYYPKTKTINGWGHWVIVYTGSSVKIYRNGIYEGQQSTSGTANWGSGMRIGYWPYGGGYAWNGQIAIVKMYNRALSDSEVTNNYNQYKIRFNLS
jgi:hypothetical protein